MATCNLDIQVENNVATAKGGTTTLELNKHDDVHITIVDSGWKFDPAASSLPATCGGQSTAGWVNVGSSGIWIDGPSSNFTATAITRSDGKPRYRIEDTKADKATDSSHPFLVCLVSTDGNNTRIHLDPTIKDKNL